MKANNSIMLLADHISSRHLKVGEKLIKDEFPIYVYIDMHYVLLVLCSPIFVPDLRRHKIFHVESLRSFNKN